MRRAFSVILSCYVFVLAAVPCDDASLWPQSACSDTAVSAAQHNHPVQGLEHDACSTFCTCQCCRTLTTPAVAPDGHPARFFSNGMVASTSTALPPGDIRLIFHPPKS